MSLFIAIILTLIFIAVPWINGMLDFYMAYRFTKENGGDKSAIGFNWLAFKWSWVTQLAYIIKMVPFLSKDLTENFGIRPDDGKVNGIPTRP